MIKNLIDADEEASPKEQETVENDVNDKVEDLPSFSPQLAEEQPLIAENKELFEIPEDAKFFKKEAEIVEEIPQDFLNEQDFIEENVTPETIPEETFAVEDSAPEIIAADENPSDIDENEKALIITVQPQFKPPSKAETIRRSGLAWSAGVIFFGSIVFMLILGWFVDLLLGTSPWGIVGGIILGSIIGFVQFFRITSQIFKNN